ncbi:sulfotransferase family protein [Microbulbifer variabilis]|uniref:sulfotransferase family protein n=1 Tax=Microbulbifer variabilis TaxID=266805 RepID=UPI001CFC6EDD|nr:sulfotransferase family protein [Microbulbifer variabilis]
MAVREIFENNKPRKDFEISTHISLKNKYVFVQISKAASSNVKSLIQAAEFHGTPWNVTNVNDKWYSPHISPFQISDEFLGEIFEKGSDFKITTFVRNPFSRLLSCYLHRIVAQPESPSNKVLKRLTGGRGGRDVTFNEFIEIICSQNSVDQEAHWRCQSDDLAVDHIKYDFIGKLENIDHDLGELLSLIYNKEIAHQLIKKVKLDMSPMKTNSSERLLEYYSDKSTVDCVLNRYEKDFLQFNYSMQLN